MNVLHHLKLLYPCAAWQLRQVTRQLPVRPISVWDSEYGCAPFVLQTADNKSRFTPKIKRESMFMERATTL